MHVADFPKILSQYRANRQQLSEMQAVKYDKSQLEPAIKKLEKLIVMSKGLTDMSVYPAFLKSLNKVVAPKTRRNVTDQMLDFVSFLIEKFGHDGPSKQRLLKPESVRESLLKYRSTFARPAKDRKKTQGWVDFAKVPSVSEFRDVKAKLCDFAEKLLKKGLAKRGLISVEYVRLMKALVGILVFRNACRVSSAVYIKHCYYNQLSQVEGGSDFAMPLAPVELNINTAMLVDCWQKPHVC